MESINELFPVRVPEPEPVPIPEPKVITKQEVVLGKFERDFNIFLGGSLSNWFIEEMKEDLKEQIHDLATQEVSQNSDILLTWQSEIKSMQHALDNFQQNYQEH